MAVWHAGLGTIAVVIVGSFIAGSEDSTERDRKDNDDDRRQVLLCPCSQGCCEDEWYQFKDACYLPVHEPENWEHAKENCEDDSAHLASVHSEDEDSFIFHLMQKREGYWLGADRTHDTANPWKWIDNSTWDYPDKLTNRAGPQLIDRVAVYERDDGGKTYWMVSKLDQQRAYVCKYLLD